MRIVRWRRQVPQVVLRRRHLRLGVLGLGFTAIRDDAVAAGSLGVRVVRSRRIVFVIAAMGSALAGTMIAAHLAGIRVFATGGIGGVPGFGCAIAMPENMDAIAARTAVIPCMRRCCDLLAIVSPS